MEDVVRIDDESQTLTKHLALPARLSFDLLMMDSFMFDGSLGN